eukprot:gene8266-11188_t
MLGILLAFVVLLFSFEDSNSWKLSSSHINSSSYNNKQVKTKIKVIKLTNIHFQQSQNLNANIPIEQYSALEDFFNATNGIEWIWQEPYSTYGYKWNFTGEPLNQYPCGTQPWQGLGCNCTKLQCYISSISLDDYNLNGFIPQTIDSLATLNVLVLSNNRLTGTIPESLGNLRNLTELHLENNMIQGSIPETFHYLTAIKMIQLNSNNLTGTIPSNLLTNMRFLVKIDLSHNQLNGSIESIDYSNNSLLQSLYFEDNILTGTIPATLSLLKQLQLLHLDYNKFNGPIPSELGQLYFLQELYLEVNLLNGNIPSELGNLSHLQILHIDYNQLVGTIPVSFSSLFFLTQFYCNNNFLSGNPFTQLLSSNASSFEGLVNLNTLYLYNNQFTSTIPSNISLLVNLFHLNISGNLFNGSIPSSIGSLVSLVALDISANLLTGTVPVELHSCVNLQVVFLHNNNFIGSLINLVNSSAQFNLTNIDVSDNQFTGPIPTEPFVLPNLISFAAVGNCLEGTIPPVMCDSPKIQQIVMDGVSSSSTCQRKYLANSNAYTSRRSLFGTIPSCLFNISSLQGLHFAGNGLTGTLPTNVILSNSFTDLCISHNSLVGTIPTIFQLHEWSKKLDLSFNKFNGNLNPNFTVNTQTEYLELDINRLSGAIPTSVLKVVNINILQGNIFTCSLSSDGNDGNSNELPHNDGSKPSYECGSNVLNISIIYWVSVALAVGLLIIMVVTFKSYSFLYGEWQSVKLWYNEKSLEDSLQSLQQLDEAINPLNISFRYLRTYRETVIKILIVCVVTGIYAACVLLPCYLIVKIKYRTYSEQYAWLISLAYISGTVPTLILLFAVLGYIALIIWFYNKMFINNDYIPYYVNSIKKKRAISISTNNSHISNSYLSTFMSHFQTVLSNTPKNDNNIADNNDDNNSIHSNINESRGSLANSYYNSTVFDDMVSIRLDSDDKTKQSTPSQSNLLSRSFRYLTSLFLQSNDNNSNITNGNNANNSIKSNRNGISTSIMRGGSYFIIIVVNIMVEMGLNILFIISTLRSSGLKLGIIEFFISLVKLLWNICIINIMLPDLTKLQMKTTKIYKLVYRIVLSEPHRMLLVAIMITMNWHTLPFIATSVIQHDCFYNLFFDISAVSASYSFNACNFQSSTPTDNNINNCVTSVSTHILSFIPEYQYSFQCSSAYLNSFSSLFIIIFALIGLVEPFLIILVLFISKFTSMNPPSSSAISIATSLPLSSPVGMTGEELRNSLSLTPNNPLITQHNNNNNNNNLNSFSTASKTIPVKDHEGLYPSRIYLFSKIQNCIPSLIKPLVLLNENPDQVRVFYRGRFTVTMVSYLSIYFTFGVALPVLGVVVMFALFSKLLMNNLLIGRFIYLTRKHKMTKLLKILSEDLKGTHESFCSILFILGVSTSSFFGYFLFDIYGDATDSMSAMWVPFIIIPSPAIMDLALRFYFNKNKMIIFEKYKQKILIFFQIKTNYNDNHINSIDNNNNNNNINNSNDSNNNNNNNSRSASNQSNNSLNNLTFKSPLHNVHNNNINNNDLSSSLLTCVNERGPDAPYGYYLHKPFFRTSDRVYLVRFFVPSPPVP